MGTSDAWRANVNPSKSEGRDGVIEYRVNEPNDGKSDPDATSGWSNTVKTRPFIQGCLVSFAVFVLVAAFVCYAAWMNGYFSPKEQSYSRVQTALREVRSAPGSSKARFDEIRSDYDAGRLSGAAIALVCDEVVSGAEYDHIRLMTHLNDRGESAARKKLASIVVVSSDAANRSLLDYLLDEQGKASTMEEVWTRDGNLAKFVWTSDQLEIHLQR
ncbi:hypothetical protein PLCT2_02242 [Planctomycetaceae bacterium]|nr:hypothetical protein PLCT2_02242 [Planctomycetaceae bacterium]